MRNKKTKILYLNLLVVIAQSILSSCGNKEEKNKFSFTVVINNQSSEVLIFQTDFVESDARGCDGETEQVNIEINEIREYFRERECDREPPSNRLTIRKSSDPSSKRVSFTFYSSKIEVVCDNDKCEASNTDIIESETPSIQEWG